jgi:hypothetical protein
MSFLGIIFVLVVLGVIGYAVNRWKQFIEPTIAKLLIFLIVVIAIVLVVWFLMGLFGVTLPSLTAPRTR